MKHLLLVPLLSAIVILGCKRSAPSVADETLIFARPGDSVGFDLARHVEGESINIAVNIFEPLVTFKTGTTEIVPALAKSWEISADGKTYTFHLRPDVKFHDGTPLNADAVIFSFDRQRLKDHPAYQFGAPYEYWENMSMSDIVHSISKIGDMTVQIQLNESNAPFLANMAMPFMSIVSPTAMMKSKENFDKEPVGTGPYQLRAWKKDDALELQANENYWGKKPSIKRVIVRVIPDNQVRALELKKGSIHIMEFPNPSDVKELEKDPNITLLKQEGQNFGYLSFNMKKKPLDRREVREAISLAIDRQRIIDEIFQGMGTLAKNPIPPQVLGYNDEVKQIPYDPEKAIQLLKDAGIKNLELEIWAMPVARPYNPNARKMAEFIQADLKRVGIESKIVSYDWGTYIDKIGKGEHQLVLIGWTGDNGDPDNFLNTLWSKDSAMKVPTNNYSFYMNDFVNQKLKEAQRETNPRKRAVLYKEIQAQMAKDIPFLPIAHSMVIVPMRKEVAGYTIHPTGDRRFSKAKFVNQP